MLRLLLIAFSFLVFAAAAQPQDNFPGITLSKEQLKRLQHDPARLKPLFDRSKSIIDKALGGEREPQLAANFVESELKAIRARVHNRKFTGVIAIFELGGTKVSVQRRIVLTRRGPFNLLLTRYGDQFVYDGDLVVPQSAIMPLDGSSTVEELQQQFPGVVFSAGFPGRFGSGTLWDDAILPFEVDDDFCCLEALEDVQRYFANNTIVRLVPRDGHENYLRFMNAEPFTTSRVELGKQPGRNEVRIQGFDYAGNPSSLGARTGSIKHELAHELGLIHEHLRSDRDRFIARNSQCSADGVFEYLRDVWIDAGNIAFTDNEAELLTAYDFSSVMHYDFVTLLSDGSTCNSWVRIGSCPGGDPTDADCIGNFGSNDYTALDLQGIHKLYAAVAGAPAFLPEPDQVHPFTDDNVRLRGKRIDKCMHGLPFGQDGCDATNRRRVAHAFCQAKGFREGTAPDYEDVMGIHSGFHARYGWQNVWGGTVLSSVLCQDFTTAEEDVQTGAAADDVFRDDEVRIGGRRVDRCVHGNGIDGDRCGIQNQQRVADAFCRAWGFAASAEFTSDLAFLAVEVNATGFDVGTGGFRDVTAADIFTEIRCLRPAAETSHRRFAISEIRLQGKQVDRCVHGTPFGEDRCTAARQRQVADNFCQDQGFDEADSFLTALSANAVGAGYHPATDDFRDVYGVVDVLSSVDCVGN